MSAVFESSSERIPRLDKRLQVTEEHQHEHESNDTFQGSGDAKDFLNSILSFLLSLRSMFCHPNLPEARDKVGW